MENSKIYFIFEKQNGKIFDVCKIGRSKRDTRKRRKELQTGNPRRLFVYEELETPFAKEWESFLHSKYDEFNTEGEWFELTPSLVDRIVNKINHVMDQNPYTIISHPLIKTPVMINNIIDNSNTNTINAKVANTNNIQNSNDVKIDQSYNYQCHRCNKCFDEYEELISHWSKTIPCDLICPECGIRFTSETVFKKHKKSNCEYHPKYSRSGNIEDKNKIKTEN